MTIPDSVKVVWFDLDDTLIDFTTNSRLALTRLYNMERLDMLWPDAARWIENYELHNMKLWSAYARGAVERDFLRMERFRAPLTDAGMSDEEARQRADRYDTLYLDLLAEERTLIPGAKETLVRLRGEGYMIGVLSNGFADVQHRKIANAGLAGLIDVTVLSDDIGINKPDPRLYYYAMEQSGHSDVSEHMMIGDNLTTDIAGAQAAGWHAVAYIHPRIAHLLPEGTPCPIVHNLDEIASKKVHN